MKTSVLAIGALILGACANIGPERSAAAPAAGRCSDAALSQFVGRARSAALGTAIQRSSGASVIQWIPAGTMVTMEYRADRVRVYLDARNNVERLSCG